MYGMVLNVLFAVPRLLYTLAPRAERLNMFLVKAFAGNSLKGNYRRWLKSTNKRGLARAYFHKGDAFFTSVFSVGRYSTGTQREFYASRGPLRWLAPALTRQWEEWAKPLLGKLLP